MQISVNKCTVMQHWTQFKLLVGMEWPLLSLNCSRSQPMVEDKFTETFLWKERTTSVCLFKDFFFKKVKIIERHQKFAVTWCSTLGLFSRNSVSVQ